MNFTLFLEIIVWGGNLPSPPVPAFLPPGSCFRAHPSGLLHLRKISECPSVCSLLSACRLENRMRNQQRAREGNWKMVVEQAKNYPKPKLLLWNHHPMKWRAIKQDNDCRTRKVYLHCSTARGYREAAKRPFHPSNSPNAHYKKGRNRTVQKMSPWSSRECWPNQFGGEEQSKNS